jgi:hypothetical protein
MSMSRHDGLTIRAVAPSVAMLLACAAALACLGIPVAARAAEPSLAGDFAAYWEGQWELLNKHIEWSQSQSVNVNPSGRGGGFLRPVRRVNGEPVLPPYPPDAGVDWARAYADEQCLIWDSDRDALDILLRRTEALLKALQDRSSVPLEAEAAELGTIRSAARQQAAGNSARKESFLQLCALQRRIALRNPLLDFDEILCMNGHGGLPGCNGVDFWQYIQFGNRRGPHLGPLAISDWKTLQPKIRRVLPDRFRLGEAEVNLSAGPGGGAAFHACYDLSFDGRTLLFAAGVNPTCIYRYELGASEVVRLTDGKHVNHYQPRVEANKITVANSGYPCWLPNGRIVFATERDGIGDRCGGVTTRLWSMKADSSDAYPISWHETPESHPVVDNDGKLIYTRWDYIDRNYQAMHNLWSCFPDGRDPRAFHGNYALQGRSYLMPALEAHIRPIPGEPGKYLALAGTHHIALPGVPILIDLDPADDRRMAQVSLLVGHLLPAECIPGARGDFGGRGRPAPGFGYVTPWPLSSDFYLASDMKNLLLLDRWGNVVPLLCGQTSGPLSGPRPLRPRPLPPVIPTATWQGERRNAPDHRRATIYVQNVYDSDFVWPAGVVEEKRIKAVRVLQIVPRPVIEWGMHHPLDIPRMVLGTAPVEEDGSAYFEAPVEKLLSFQALDADGLPIQGMKTGTYVHPGEQLACQGCHEGKHRVPSGYKSILALGRPPSKLQPDVDGSLPLNYARLVQPLFEGKCVTCHKKEGKGPADLGPGAKIKCRGWGLYHVSSWGSGPGLYHSDPYSIGAHGSRLGQTLLRSHRDRLTAEEFHRVTLWLDCNSMRFCAFHDLEAQQRGETVWPAIDCDPKNPQGVESDRPLERRP